MQFTEKQANYFQVELQRFFDVDVDLCDVRQDGMSLQIDWYFRFDLDGRRCCLSVDKNGRFEATVGDIVEGSTAWCMWTGKAIAQSVNTQQVGRNITEQHEAVMTLSAAI